MIVLESDSGRLMVVQQPEHAMASRAVAESWLRPRCLPEPIWRRFIEAVGRHDDGWREAERRPAVDGQGRPYDFKSIPADEHLAIWRRSIELAATDDPYAALLICLHARCLYVRFGSANGDEKVIQAFIAELTDRADGFIRVLTRGGDDEVVAVQPEPLDMAAGLLTFLDGLTLRLVGALPWVDRTPAVAFADDHAAISIRPCEGGASLRPWPLASPELPITIMHVVLDRRRFDDPPALRQAIRRAGPSPRNFRLTPG